MKRVHRAIMSASLFTKARPGVLAIGLALVSMASMVSPAWGQWLYGSGGAIYYNGGNVGIGTNNPAGPLHIYSGGAVFYDRMGSPAHVVVRSANGSVGYPTALWKDGIVGRLSFTGYDGTSWAVNSYTGLRALATENWYAGAHGASLAFYTTPNGTYTEQQRILIDENGKVGIGTSHPQYLLSVRGVIGAQEVVVTNYGWSDYVFQPGYRLRPLREVGAYIRANRHLPDIPSAAEVKQKGVSVGEMQSRLLAKIEELTLHMIRAEERNDRLENQNRELRERIARLEKAAAGATATH
jgi:hypothetical protein